MELNLPFPSSPRVRRRLGWATGILGVAGVAVAIFVSLPSAHQPPERFEPGKPQVVSTPKEVPLSRADHHAIDRVIDRFVRAAVLRRDLDSAYALATPNLRSQVSRAAWRQGRIPVMKYPAGGVFHDGWTLDYSTNDTAALVLMLEPRKGLEDRVGNIVFNVDLKRSGHSWKVDSFATAAVYTPHNKPLPDGRKILSTADFSAGAGTMARDKIETHDTAAWILPAMLALLLGIPILLVGGIWARNRRGAAL
jgi:hypothetical protein